MNYDSFLSSPRWEILEIIAKEPSSPIEIAKQISTSVSYVSQQLKLLEAAGLVGKNKTGKVEKGKPRLIYSISREILQLTGLLRNMPVKKHLYLTGHHKTILRIWMLDNEDIHYYLEKLYWKVEDDLEEIRGIFVDLSKMEILVISDSKKIRTEIENFLKKTEKKLNVKIISEKELSALSNLHTIHDPNLMFRANI